VIPHQFNDMHSASIAQGDHWLKSHMGAYANWTKAHNSLLIVTWDEGRGGTNHIPTIFFGARVHKGSPGLASDHYRLLRTIEGMYGLTPLGQAANNAPLRKVFMARAAKATTSAVTSSPSAPAQQSSAIFSDQRIEQSAWEQLMELL